MKNYLNFIKIEHTLFSLPIVYSGAFLALSLLDKDIEDYVLNLMWIFFAVLGARAAGFGFNRILDAEIDAKNPRTKNREIPAGKISVRAAWVFVFLFSILYIFSAAQLSQLCLILSPIPLVLFYFYPYLKRWTMWAHLGLGIAWGIAPLGGWLAIDSSLNSIETLTPAFLLALFCIFWVAGFDIIYALMDREFDRTQGLYSMPAILGSRKALIASRIFHAIAFSSLTALIGIYLNNALSYFFLALCAVLFSVSHWKVSIRPISPANINFAFFKVNVVLAFVVFLTVVI